MSITASVGEVVLAIRQFCQSNGIGDEFLSVLSCVDSMAGINDFITLFKKCHGGHAGNFETMLTAFNLKKELAALTAPEPR